MPYCSAGLLTSGSSGRRAHTRCTHAAHTLAQAALAVGCTLAPTSMGIALNVLKQAKLLNTPTGQLIIAAAVLDDVIALLLLSELQALGNPTPVALMAPIAVSLGLMLFFGGVAVFVMPGLISFVMPRIPQQQQPYVLLGAVSSPTRHAHTHAPTHAHIHAHHHAHIHAHVHAHIHAPTHTRLPTHTQTLAAGLRDKPWVHS